MDALDAIFTRRSTRKLSERRPPRDLVARVVEAGRAAPSGSNSQSTHLIVLSDPEMLGALARLVEREFAAMEESEDTYVSLRASIRASKKGGYVFHYHAPVLIVTANRKGYGNALADSACALENMMIAANALDLGACWINQLHWLDDRPSVRAFLEPLGLLPGETVTGGLALGYASQGAPIREKRETPGNPVTWIWPENVP